MGSLRAALPPLLARRASGRRLPPLGAWGPRWCPQEGSFAPSRPCPPLLDLFRQKSTAAKDPADGPAGDSSGTPVDISADVEGENSSGTTALGTPNNLDIMIPLTPSRLGPRSLSEAVPPKLRQRGQVDASLSLVNDVVRFTAEEDRELMLGVTEHGLDYEKIKDTRLPHRTTSMLARRWRTINPNVNHQRWTVEEDEKMKKLYLEHKNFRAVAMEFPDRTRKQVISRFRRIYGLSRRKPAPSAKDHSPQTQAFLKRVSTAYRPWSRQSKTPWTLEEITTLYKNVQRYGTKWALVCLDLPGRSSGECSCQYWLNRHLIEAIILSGSTEGEAFEAALKARRQPWTPEEDHIVLTKIPAFWRSTRPYQIVSQRYLPHRDPVSIRQRFVKLDRLTLRFPFTDVERKLLARAVEVFGPNFEMIQRLKAFERRSTMQLARVYKSLITTKGRTRTWTDEETEEVKREVAKRLAARARGELPKQGVWVSMASRIGREPIDVWRRVGLVTRRRMQPVSTSKGSKRGMTVEQEAEARRLRSAGVHIGDIANILGVRPRTVENRLLKFIVAREEVVTVEQQPVSEREVASICGVIDRCLVGSIPQTTGVIREFRRSGAVIRQRRAALGTWTTEQDRALLRHVAERYAGFETLRPPRMTKKEILAEQESVKAVDGAFEGISVARMQAIEEAAAKVDWDEVSADLGMYNEEQQMRSPFLAFKREWRNYLFGKPCRMMARWKFLQAFMVVTGKDIILDDELEKEIEQWAAIKSAGPKMMELPALLVKGVKEGKRGSRATKAKAEEDAASDEEKPRRTRKASKKARSVAREPAVDEAFMATLNAEVAAMQTPKTRKTKNAEAEEDADTAVAPKKQSKRKADAPVEDVKPDAPLKKSKATKGHAEDLAASRLMESKNGKNDVKTVVEGEGDIERPKTLRKLKAAKADAEETPASAPKKVGKAKKADTLAHDPKADVGAPRNPRKTKGISVDAEAITVKDAKKGKKADAAAEDEAVGSFTSARKAKADTAEANIDVPKKGRKAKEGKVGTGGANGEGKPAKAETGGTDGEAVQATTNTRNRVKASATGKKPSK